MAVASAGPPANNPPRCRQITTPTPHHSIFYRPDALPDAKPIVSKHWRLYISLEKKPTTAISATVWMTNLHKIWHNDAERVCELHAVKRSNFKNPRRILQTETSRYLPMIQNRPAMICWIFKGKFFNGRCTWEMFYIIASNVVEIGHTVAETSQLIAFF